MGVPFTKCSIAILESLSSVIVFQPCCLAKIRPQIIAVVSASKGESLSGICFVAIPRTIPSEFLATIPKPTPAQPRPASTFTLIEPCAGADHHLLFAATAISDSAAAVCDASSKHRMKDSAPISFFCRYYSTNKYNMNMQNKHETHVKSGRKGFEKRKLILVIIERKNGEGTNIDALWISRDATPLLRRVQLYLSMSFKYKSKKFGFKRTKMKINLETLVHAPRQKSKKIYRVVQPSSSSLEWSRSEWMIKLPNSYWTRSDGMYWASSRTDFGGWKLILVIIDWKKDESTDNKGLWMSRDATPVLKRFQPYWSMCFKDKSREFEFKRTKMKIIQENPVHAPRHMSKKTFCVVRLSFNFFGLVQV